MAIQTANSVAVDDDPAVLLSAADNEASYGGGWTHQLVVTNSGDNTLYVGGSSDVDDDDGFPIAAGATLTLTVKDPDVLYGICASSESTTADIIRTGIPG